MTSTTATTVTEGLDPQRLAHIADALRPYQERGALPDWTFQVSRRGQVAASIGGTGRTGAPATGQPAIYRIYSMTKPITSVAAMMLYEQGSLDLNAPVASFIPSYADLRVYVGGPATAPVTRPATTPMRIKHLLTHTSGLTYGFHRTHLTDELYRQAGYEFNPLEDDLATACDAWAALPLRFDPGTSWLYSVSTDVLGRVVEVVSGQRLDIFFADHILGPLGMTDTAFHAVDPQRLAPLHLHTPDGAKVLERFGADPAATPTFLSGGGGLYSTMDDYQRFADFLLARGELDGTRLLGPRTVDFMSTNHLPGDVDLDEFGIPLYAETPFTGVGFGLGFSITLDPVATGIGSTAGEYGWGGLASTYFWIDPVEQLTAIFMTQLMPSSALPIRPLLKQIVYSALVD